MVNKRNTTENHDYMFLDNNKLLSMGVPHFGFCGIVVLWKKTVDNRKLYRKIFYNKNIEEVIKGLIMLL